MKPTSKDLQPTYEPQQVEQRIYKSWLEGGFFTAKIDKSKQPFVIIQPPPNVTGELHLGHAQRATIEDMLTRWHRMKGDPTLWLPGLDHAGIATQVVVERDLVKEGLTRHDLGREKFLERMWNWVNTYRARIGEQHQRLGASCDWSREQFTLDPKPSKAVRFTFVSLYKKGLIYRGERIINWCPRCETALSDLEVEHKDIEGTLYYIKYELTDKSGSITVATTRPETVPGDTAIAVNPNDSRYTSLVGKEVSIPILSRNIPIIADEIVDQEFGTGALKITPGHDPTDFEIGVKHNLPVITAINFDGTMSEDAGTYSGLDRTVCRETILNDLDREGYLVKIEKYNHTVGHCQRCSQIVEPLVSKQWFMRMEPLARRALDSVETGAIRILPEHFNRVYVNWLLNIRDWCFSRQLWWGHRIPVWYCQSCETQIVEEEDPNCCNSCGSIEIYQDPDVLDTWFSSGLWPLSTLGWPDDTDDLQYFFPTSVMETGHDILFFWVARMIMLSLENTDKVPFRTVYLSGLIRDPQGIKMSKTRGNVLDPLQLIDTYGCDALRFAITVGNAPGSDTRLGTDKLEAARNFANKIWNAARFVIRSIDGCNNLSTWESPAPSYLEDRWILSRLNRLIIRVNSLMEEFQLGEVPQVIHEFLWNEYCDWYIETSKVRLAEDYSTTPILTHVLEKTLRLLHPSMPFITEEIWQHLRNHLPKMDENCPSIVIAAYPEADYSLLDEEAERTFDLVMNIVRAIRNIRSEFRLNPSQYLDVIIDAGHSQTLLTSEARNIKTIARVKNLDFIEHTTQTIAETSVTAFVGTIALYVPLAELVDLHKERVRLENELQETELKVTQLNKRLGDSKFTLRAPDEVVERERARLEDLQIRFQRIEQFLKQIPK